MELKNIFKQVKSEGFVQDKSCETKDAWTPESVNKPRQALEKKLPGLASGGQSKDGACETEDKVYKDGDIAHRKDGDYRRISAGKWVPVKKNGAGSTEAKPGLKEQYEQLKTGAAPAGKTDTQINNLAAYFESQGESKDKVLADLKTKKPDEVDYIYNLLQRMKKVPEIKDPAEEGAPKFSRFGPAKTEEEAKKIIEAHEKDGYQMKMKKLADGTYELSIRHPDPIPGETMRSTEITELMNLRKAKKEGRLGSLPDNQTERLAELEKKAEGKTISKKASNELWAKEKEYYDKNGYYNDSQKSAPDESARIAASKEARAKETKKLEAKAAGDFSKYKNLPPEQRKDALHAVAHEGISVATTQRSMESQGWSLTSSDDNQNTYEKPDGSKVTMKLDGTKVASVDYKGPTAGKTKLTPEQEAEVKARKQKEAEKEGIIRNWLDETGLMKKSASATNEPKMSAPKNAGRGDYIKIGNESVRIEYAVQGRYGSELGTLLQYTDPETGKNGFALQTKSGELKKTDADGKPTASESKATQRKESAVKSAKNDDQRDRKEGALVEYKNATADVSKKIDSGKYDDLIVGTAGGHGALEDMARDLVDARNFAYPDENYADAVGEIRDMLESRYRDLEEDAIGDAAPSLRSIFDEVKK